MPFPDHPARLAEAFEVAARLHADQTRKSTGQPYLSHLLAVAGMVIENGGDEDQAIAALLHDGPEDRGGEHTLEEIRSRFGARVAEMVLDCSDTLETPKPEWRPRKERYIDHARREASAEALLVSLADKVHNLTCIERDLRLEGEALWERFTADSDQTRCYYDSLCAVYEERLGERYPNLVRQMRHLLEAVWPPDLR